MVQDLRSLLKKLKRSKNVERNKIQVSMVKMD